MTHRIAHAAADVAAMRATSIFVVGDILLDVYVEGAVERISPEAPVPVLREHARRAVLGGAANVAANVAAFTRSVQLAGRVGDDDDGREVLSLLVEAGVDADAVTAGPPGTIRKTRLLSGHQQLARIDREEIVEATSDEVSAVIERFRAFVRDRPHPALIVSDYGKGVVSAELLRTILDEARALGVPSVVDPKPRSLRGSAGATIIKPNRAEARAAVIDASPDELALCRAVLDASGADNVVVSLSERGVVAAGSGIDGVAHIPSRALDVADVSGAGDTMVAVLALGAAAGLPLRSTVEFANAAAGVVCARHGTAVITPSDLLSAWKDATEATEPDKFLATYAEAAQFSEAYRDDGRRVVFANGCFDVLHAGHVRLLQYARGLGDVLVVALNSDASVARLKGPSRPVQRQDDRAAVLASLAAVDAVVVFEEDTPLDVITAIRPDVIVKGGDYRPEDVVGGREAAAWGGTVAIVPLLEGRSSTAVLTALQSEA